MTPEPTARIEEEVLSPSGGVMIAVGNRVTSVVSPEGGKMQE